MGYAEAIEQQMRASRTITRRGGTGDAYLPVVVALAEGAPYFVAREIGGLVAMASASLPEVRGRDVRLPTRAGFALLESNAGVLGTIAQARVLFAEGWRECAALAWWQDPETGDITIGQFTRAEVADEGMLVLGNQFARPPQGGDLFLAYGDTWRPDERHVPDDPDDLEAVAIALGRGYLAALALFLEQRVLVSSARPILNRQARRRLARALGHMPLVNVVELRRREYQRHDESQARNVDWRCQWLVRGHWVNQYHPSTGEHKPLWRMPHIKGPADKPLKAPQVTAYEVRR